MPVVVALGSFNLVNSAHLRALHAANAAASRLVIAVADDDLVAERTGEAPNIGVDERVELIEAFFPDAEVAVADTDDAAGLVEQFGADALAVPAQSNPQRGASVGGVQTMAIAIASSSALRNHTEDVIWFPRSG